MIKIQNYNKDQEKLSFTTDMEIGLANAIRRSVLEIPVLAIDEVEIMKNDSALFDEIVAHRLGLVPIKTDKLTGKEQKFKLKAKGPCTVYATEIKPSIETGFKLPITILDEEQELELNAVARTGIGNEHIKYSPGLFYYKNNLDEELLDLIRVDGEGKVIYDEQELKDKGFSEEQILKLKKIDNAGELAVFIESWGQMDCKSIFTKAIEVLDKNLKELSKAVK